MITIKFMKEAMYEGLAEDFCFKQFTDNQGEILRCIYNKVQLSNQSARKCLYTTIVLY